MNDGMMTVIYQCPRCDALCRFARRAPEWSEKELAQRGRDFMQDHNCEARDGS
jgi:hypothetical protein